jgi:hypothetical protein
MTKNAIPVSPDFLEHERWLDGIVPLREGARLAAVSVHTLKREARKGRYQLIAVSERRWGIRRRNALQLPAREAAAKN